MVVSSPNVNSWSRFADEQARELEGAWQLMREAIVRFDLYKRKREGVSTYRFPRYSDFVAQRYGRNLERMTFTSDFDTSGMAGDIRS